MSRSFDQAVFRQKLYNWVVRTDQAFRVTEEPSFKDLIKYCSSSARIVGGDTIKRDLMENFALNRAALSEELSVRKSSRYSYYGFFNSTCRNWNVEYPWHWICGNQVQARITWLLPVTTLTRTGCFNRYYLTLYRSHYHILERIWPRHSWIQWVNSVFHLRYYIKQNYMSCVAIYRWQWHIKTTLLCSYFRGVYLKH